VEALRFIFSNYYLDVAFVAWAAAQGLKFVIYCFTEHKLRWERLIGNGGMPSSHSATVTALTIAVYRVETYRSPLFALVFIFAIVVMTDAMGVRLETGRQAKVINDFMESIPRDPKTGMPVFYDFKSWKFTVPEKELKEFIGHTPIEVLAGLVIGLIIGIFMPVPLGVMA